MSSIEDNDYYNFIKKIFDEIDEAILKSQECDNSQTIPNVEGNDDDVTLDQRDKSIVNLDVTADDELLLCIADRVVKNKKDDNENICSVADLPSQETVISDLSDDESTPKKSKQFTFTDSDFPDSDEIEEFLKEYPRPPVTSFPWIESESKINSDEESKWFSRRRRKKMIPVSKITIEKLPERFMTRQRKPNIYLVSKKDCYRVLQSIYLKKHEDQTDEEIIRENVKRLKTSNKKKIPESKHTKFKSFAVNNITHDIISIVKTTTRRTRYMKNKGVGKNNKNKSISIRYKNNYKRKRGLKNERSILLIVKGRRSKRNQKTKEKDKDMMKTPLSVPKTGDNNKNKSISTGNDNNDFIRKRALKKERSTLPVVEGRRSKTNQKKIEKDEDTMKARVSVPKSDDKNSISSGKHVLRKERSTLPAVEGRRSNSNQKTKEKDEDTMKAPVSVPKSDDKHIKNISSGKRALKKGRSTLPSVEGRRGKRNQKIKEKDKDTMKAPVSVPKTEDKNNKNKNISSGKRALKKGRSSLPVVEARRSNRNQKTKEKDKEPMKAAVSVPKKRVHVQSTAYNILSSSSESPKGLKRSLVDDSDVLSPKRTRSHNNKITNAPTSVKPTEKIRGLEPDKRVSKVPARRGRRAA